MCTACRAKETGGLKRSTFKSPTSKSKVDYSAFFARHIAILGKHPYSQNSGKRISNPSKLNICHILPKRKTGGFPSVAEEDLNIVYLTWDEHTRFDGLLFSAEYGKIAEEMPTLFGLLQDRIPKLLEICRESNKMFFSLGDYFVNNT